MKRTATVLKLVLLGCVVLAGAAPPEAAAPNHVAPGQADSDVSGVPTAEQIAQSKDMCNKIAERLKSSKESDQSYQKTAAKLLSKLDTPGRTVDEQFASLDVPRTLWSQEYLLFDRLLDSLVAAELANTDEQKCAALTKIAHLWNDMPKRCPSSKLRYVYYQCDDTYKPIKLLNVAQETIKPSGYSSKSLGVADTVIRSLITVKTDLAAFDQMCKSMACRSERTPVFHLQNNCKRDLCDAAHHKFIIDETGKIVLLEGVVASSETQELLKQYHAEVQPTYGRALASFIKFGIGSDEPATLKNALSGRGKSFIGCDDSLITLILALSNALHASTRPVTPNHDSNSSTYSSGGFLSSTSRSISSLSSTSRYISAAKTDFNDDTKLAYALLGFVGFVLLVAAIIAATEQGSSPKLGVMTPGELAAFLKTIQ